MSNDPERSIQQQQQQQEGRGSIARPSSLSSLSRQAGFLSSHYSRSGATPQGTPAGASATTPILSRPSLLAGLSLSSGPISSAPPLSSNCNSTSTSTSLLAASSAVTGESPLQSNKATGSSSSPSIILGGSGISSLIPPRPRRLWKVNDTSLRAVPYFYPPLNPRCCVFISDAPPSVVAVRIAECLRKRSVSVEYDEEAITATAMTVDRCHFVVHMWQGRTASGTNNNSSITTSRAFVDANAKDNTYTTVPDSSSSIAGVGVSMDQATDHLSSSTPNKVDFSHGLIVECVRIRGNVITFHHNCRAILQAALSHGTGEDDREDHQLTPLDFRKRVPPTRGFLQQAPQNTKKHKTSTTNKSSLTKALEALEHVISLLKKDRLEPQQLAMETLVTLTDPYTSGTDVAIHCSLAVLGVPITGSIGENDELHYDDEDGVEEYEYNNTADMIGLFMSDPETLLQFHYEWIVRLIQDRILPNETYNNNTSSKKKKKDGTPKKKKEKQKCSLNDSGMLSSFSCSSSLFGGGGGAAERAERERQTGEEDHQQNAMLLREASLIEFNISSDNNNNKNKSASAAGGGGNSCDEYHGGILRSLSLRAFCNALECICNARKHLLTGILKVQSSHIVSKQFLSVLLDDLSGVTRPPIIVRGTRLASIHESTLVLKCLRLLGQNSDAALDFILTDTVLTTIEKLRSTGKSTHSELAQEAESIYETLTEEARSC